MKKIALTALAAMIGATGFVSTASAGSRDQSDQWHRHGERDNGRWNDRRDNNRDARRHDRDRSDRRWDRADRGDRRWHPDHRRHWHGGRDHWRPGYGPRVVFRYDARPDYCFVKKVRRYDDWGNAYIKRVRVCR